MNSPFRQSEVFNLGICGARTGDIIRRELPEALSLGGEVFLLLAGTNDMLGDAGHGVSPEEYESNMRYLISALSAAGRVMVLTIPPVAEEREYQLQPAEKWTETPTERIALGNAVIERLVAAFCVRYSPDFLAFRPGQLRLPAAQSGQQRSG